MAKIYCASFYTVKSLKKRRAGIKFYKGYEPGSVK
jgi:hypothetical protein